MPPRVQWLLDSMTMSSAFVRNGRTDVVAANPLARALLAPMFDSATADQRGRTNIARYIFLDPGVLIRHDGTNRLRHPEVGHLDLTFQSLDLPLPGRAVHDLIIYTAEPGTASEDRLKLLASWAATRSRRAEPATPRSAGPAVPAGRSPWRGAGRRPRG
ncbi:hypothetical protein [Amycolatopsis sp. ATCC 39116]|uniref:MmyB family transcriptional regulator n=1 Tax=Amycolatopsis sp. (strain ATCC 39116 / 75iv2) TaxID=385957 RepID=UPI002101155E|nr:hypothetical protein [Amycolatopsis sp. ATCC 39116]